MSGIAYNDCSSSQHYMSMFALMLRTPRWILMLALLGISVLWLWSSELPWRGSADSESSLTLTAVKYERLHLVIPATSSNRYLCQLLLSSTILGYAKPFLINWGIAEEQDNYVQHLAKVKGILNYLDALSPDQDNDLFLMVDGYDVWFQLPPEILISRYHAVVAASQKRYTRTSWKHRILRKRSSTDTVIFGQDKVCWPSPSTRAACWAVPDSTLSPQAFGPDTDHGIAEHNRPRWLNSGTIMGPVKDVRNVFTATLQKIRENNVENSDQFHFANVFADQSFARGPTDTQVWPPLDTAAENRLEIPDIPSDRQTEYGIGIDYESSLFQTVAYYEASITWIMYNRSSYYEFMAVTSESVNPFYHFTLPLDLSTSLPPRDLLQPSNHTNPYPDSQLSKVQSGHESEFEYGSLQSWFTVPLGINTITKQVFPILHFTGKKGYRDMWWGRMWYFPFAERAMRERLDSARVNVGPGGIDSDGDGDGAKIGKDAGVTFESTSGELGWEGICGRYEDYLFGRAL